ncbi:MAG: 1,4-alpha-glucan branching protein GlgB [Oscillibacter sp.]|nr:1,4-alpha-glucan branching protein GlgB [Oscillibacter sp.]
MAKHDYAERFHAGTLTDGWRWFGSHPDKKNGAEGWTFRVWAPHAQSVCVVGDFNSWTDGVHPLTRDGEIWEGFIPGLGEYTSYKYAVTGPDGEVRLKTDPYAFHCETRPATAGKLYDIEDFKWTDAAFLAKQEKHQVYESPLNIYEVHLGSWKKRPNGDFYDYKDMAKELAAYVKEMGYTAIELLPVLEHPFDGSWGYQCTGYFAPTSRYGTPKDFLWFVNHMHKNGIAVRVDAVASMLYLDYSRQGGAWTPNKYGGHENLEAIDFLRELNAMAFSVKPGVMMIAEESTAWPMVSRPADIGGLGFNLKWNMGWMNDMCHYLKLDPWFRQDHHKDITFSMMYAFSENFVLPISHDEVVHMKGSVVGKMPGDYTNQLRCTRGFYAYLLAHPGKKLLFMGAELGQWHEWNDKESLDWYLLENEENQKIHRFFKEANDFYKKEPALWEIDFSWEGFEWLVVDDNHNNVVVFLRKDKKGRDLLCAVNFSPNTYEGYRMGVPAHKQYTPVFNTDAAEYGGDGFGDTEPVPVEAAPSHGKEHSAAIRIPAFGAVFLRGEGTFPKPKAVKEPKAPKAVKAVEKVSKAAGKTVKASAKALVKTVKSSAKAEKAPKEGSAEKPARKPRAKKQAKELKET